MRYENLLSTFKNELGYINATNQYVELSVRITERDYESTLRENLQGLAKSVNLNVSNLAEDYMHRISKSYIVNVHSCFENFLKSFKCFPGSPTNISSITKNNDDDWLEWTLGIAVPVKRNEIKNDIIICEYYRLVRNCVVHNGTISAEMKNKRSLISTSTNSRLHAPNDVNSLTFDDQVLFSRAANNVANFIFKNSQYNICAIVEAHKENLLNLVKPYQELTARSIAVKKMKRYISLLYPEFTDVDWEQEIANLLS